MNVNPVKINIELDSWKSGKWYAKKEVRKDKETIVNFFQRDGKRSLLQKFQDFRNNVRSGTELASKYSKELGLTEDAFSNPKNKSVKSSISNQKLDEFFRAANNKLDNDEPFQKSDPLVSRSYEEIDIRINNTPVLADEDFKNMTLRFFSSQMVNANKIYTDYKDHIALALDIRANPSFTTEGKKIDKAIEALQELRNINLSGYEYSDMTNYNYRKFEFNEKVDSLITVLEKGSKREVDKEKNYEVRKDVKMHIFKLDMHRDYRNDPEFSSHLGLAMDVRDKPNFSARKDEMEAAKKALTDFKKADGYVLREIKNRVDKSVADLVKALDAAIAKASLQTPTN
jgi:hypothetical protein